MATSRVRSSSGGWPPVNASTASIDGADDPRRVEVATAEDLVEPLDAELDAAGVHGLGDAVGVERQDVAGLERRVVWSYSSLVEEAQRRAADLLERVDDPLAAPLQPRRVVPGAGVGQRPRRRVEDAVERRDEHLVAGGVALAQLPVDMPQQRRPAAREARAGCGPGCA